MSAVHCSLIDIEKLNILRVLRWPTSSNDRDHRNSAIDSLASVRWTPFRTLPDVIGTLHETAQLIHDDIKPASCWNVDLGLTPTFLRTFTFSDDTAGAWVYKDWATR